MGSPSQRSVDRSGISSNGRVHYGIYPCLCTTLSMPTRLVANRMARALRRALTGKRSLFLSLNRTGIERQTSALEGSLLDWGARPFTSPCSCLGSSTEVARLLRIHSSLAASTILLVCTTNGRMKGLFRSSALNSDIIDYSSPYIAIET